MALTVTDMNRLEQAARLSMGGFQDPEASTSPSPRAYPMSFRFIAFVLVAVLALIAVVQLA